MNNEQPRDLPDRDAAAKAEDERLRHNIPQSSRAVGGAAIDRDREYRPATGVGNVLEPRQSRLKNIEDKVDEILEDLNVDQERERTPIGGTPIVLNPKVDDDAIALCCPECGEEIAAESFKHGMVVEYRCGCDDLQKFKISGVQHD